MSEHTTKAPHEMTAREALLDYGFEAIADNNRPGQRIYTRLGSQTQAWQPTDGGWIRLDPPTAPLIVMHDPAEGNVDPANGAPWGRPVEGTSYVQVPYKQAERFETVSGLHPATHPECFEWVWPDEEVAKIYAFAYRGDRPRQWHKNAEGRIVQGSGERE